MCLCMMLAPELKPELKNMKAFMLAMTMAVALKSSMFSGSIYFSNSFVMMITCLSHTENLLNMSEWVSVTSPIRDPFSKGA